MTPTFSCLADYQAEILRQLEYIKQLEHRIIQLEVEITKKRLVMNDDSWYWDH
jgi:hypothetical protein